MSPHEAYPHQVDSEVIVHQTHISIVFLAGEFAYKVKKPIKTDFLDYSTLELRRHYCEEEMRLNSRYGSDLYLGVVAIRQTAAGLLVDESNTDDRTDLVDLTESSSPTVPTDLNQHIVEYAVKMRRFPAGALLSERLDSGRLTTGEVIQLADIVASFHRTAAVCDPDFAAAWPDFLVKNIDQIVSDISSQVDRETAVNLKVLHQWSDDFLSVHLSTLAARGDAGFIRECHGDLHLRNVVHWDDRLTPFDGIEFNEQLRWIDVLSDAAFLTMDFAAHGHLNLSHSFMNAYLERAGDYDSLVLLRWFLMYRSLVRAFAASIRLRQGGLTSDDIEAAQRDICDHIQLARRFTQSEEPRLWITHGFSGSGKTTLSENVIERHDAFRLRSDIERKRIFGLLPSERPSVELQAKMYNDDASEKTYGRLEELASKILRAGYGVIIDATFLKRHDRDRFHDLAKQAGVAFAILDCQADESTLRQRIADRLARNDDASDADLKVLDCQLRGQQPLTESEREYVVEIPDLVKIAERL
jgi:aminoglycoside phosphotransferase family enzyme/predicted kinase